MSLRLHHADIHADCGEQLPHAVVQFPGDALPFIVLHALKARGQVHLLFSGGQVSDQNSSGQLISGQQAE
ncbi:MAG: hypothetical protein ABSE28_00335 [Candidatus Sulfotelmatobacter sp.]|jgi:hypothetical protein